MKYPLAELLDRYAIEARKGAYGAANTPTLQQLSEELVSLGSWYALLVMHAIELAVANADIANLEWQIREGKQLSAEEVGQRALKIREINDRRVAAKQHIAELVGEPPEQRVYGYGQGLPADLCTLDIQQDVQALKSRTFAE